MKKPTPEAATDLDQFATQFLDQKGLYGWQKAAMRDLTPPGSRVAVKAANGSGKTTKLSAPAAVWNALMFPGSLTVTTSGVFRQVKEQMWPAIRQMARPFAHLGISLNQTDMTLAGSRIIGFSTDDPGRFEGWHDDNLLMILDEAKSIKDEIFQAVERCQPNRLLVISSPGGTSGQFYDIFANQQERYSCHTVTSFDCPHISKDWIKEQINRWGQDHPLIRSMIYGEFMELDGEQLVIPYSSLSRCIADPPRPKGDELVVGCDFAAGGDENVVVYRHGNRIMPPIAWKERNTMAAVGRFITEFRRIGAKPENVYGDVGGLGLPMIDALREAGWPINRVQFGGRAGDSDSYGSRAAEMWFTAARLIEMQDIIIPDDEALQAQLCNRRCKSKSTGQLMLESKEEMKLRGLSSPDRADAFVQCVASSRVNSNQLGQYIRPSLEEMFGHLWQDDEVLPGTNVGD